MKHAADLSLAAPRPVARCVAAAMALVLATTAHGAPTEISQTPLLTTTAALVKPNVMLLMDASGSMGRTHMPDEVETLTGPSSIGYKSAQCNVLYYNPNTTYLLPKDSTGTPFPLPSFSAAPYAGFGSYYTPPDSHAAVDLRSQFVAYDTNTLENTGYAYPDTAQAAYYFVYSGSALPLKYTDDPCTQDDTGGSAPATGGSWTKVVVGLAEQQNFANWYAFYRTRLALIKSAASLAFAPLNDTKRVGFITVSPKDSTDPAVGINPLRFLPVGDFNSAQKSLWFAKLFSQAASGASPSREGLARVGRYYGGQENYINKNMPATGTADPIQYSCQQNFTIMTTDGYWNGQTETTGPYGGALNLDGSGKVGQQDGDLSDPYSPRPIWDGTTSGIRTDIDKVNSYTDNLCSLIAGRYKSTFQTTKRTFVITKDTKKYPRHTVQYKKSSSQSEAQTTVTTKTVTQTPMTTEQYAFERHYFVVERWKTIRWREQTTKVMNQFRLRTSQQAKRTKQTTKTVTQTTRTAEQWTMSSSQYVLETSQYKFGKDQLTWKVEQTNIYKYQILKKVGADEVGVPDDGTCVPVIGFVRCVETPVLTMRLIDPDSCSNGRTGAPFYVFTKCTPGPMTDPEHVVPLCTPGAPVHSGSPNFTKSTCTRNIIVPFAATATPCGPVGSWQGPSPDYYIYTCDRPPANNTSVPQSTPCSGSSSTGMPDYITTTCTQPSTTNYATRPAPACSPLGPSTTTDGTYISTVCTKLPNVVSYSDSCMDDPGTFGPDYIKVTCSGPALISTEYAPSASCIEGATTGSPDYKVTHCATAYVAPYATATPVSSCSAPAPIGPDYIETECSNPPAYNTDDFVPSCSPLGPSGGSGPDYINYNCSKTFDDATSFEDPALCHEDDGSTYPYLRTHCTTVTTVPREPVDPRLECGTTFTTTVGPGPGYVVTHCEKEAVGGVTEEGACSGPAIGPGPDFITTSCGDGYRVDPVAYCDTSATYPDDGIYTVRCIKPVGSNNTTINIPGTCSPTSGPPVGPDFVTVTCPTGSSATTYVDPRTCPAGTDIGPSPDVIVTTCSAPAAVGPYIGWTGVPSCSDYWNGSYLTSCRTPVATNFSDRDSEPCSTHTDPGEVHITCTQEITDDYPPSCSDVPQTGTGPDISCGAPIVSTGVPTASCALGTFGTLVDAETITACNTTSDTGFVDFAGACTIDGGSDPTWVQTQCGEHPVLTHVADSGCTIGFDVSTGIRTDCVNESGGSGHLYSVQVIQTVTTTPYSGSVPSGPSVPVVTSGSVGPVDGVCYPAPHVFPAKPPVDVTGCSVWPCSSTAATAIGSENSLADVAQYYYKTDLRPLMTDNVPSAGTGIEDDNTPHQHMTTFTIGLGVSGTLVYNPDYRSPTMLTGDFAAIRLGTKNWPLWPDTAVDYTDFDNYNNPKSIDDFWHTAVNGRGRYFSANDPTSVVQGLGDALAKIDDKVASGAADSVSTLQPTSTNNFVYSTSYQSGVWQGDVEAKRLDLTTGAPGAPVWSAKDKLGPRELNTCDAREIHVLKGGGGAPSLTPFALQSNLCPSRVEPGSPADTMDVGDRPYFGIASLSQLSQWSLMSPAQQAELVKPANAGWLVDFLRGQRAHEGFAFGSLTKMFRTRGEGVVGEGILGDIVDSQPVYVGEPFANYQENSYDVFKAGNAVREPMLYVGGNDGMLHAFYASLSASYAGQEAWAVIPSAVLPNLYKLADVNYKRDGHQFYVDGTPVVGDVWNGSAWRTLLVGGLSAGGKGYYALDVTVPGVLPTPKWEFKLDLGTCPAASLTAVALHTYFGDCNLGLTFGKPIITKLAGKWVAMFTSGYNNLNGAGSGDGGGYLYVVDALDGSLIYKLPTGYGDGATPSGLGQINNYVNNVLLDNTSVHVYGGDLQGHMFRFDFLPSTAVTLLGTAKDLATSAVEPITVRPELAELDGKPFILFGTGRFLGAGDVTNPQTQSVYGFRDPLTTGSTVYADPMRNVLKPMKISQTVPTDVPDHKDYSTVTRTIACTGSVGDCARPAGFVLDLAEAGERINVEMKLVLGALVFASNTPADEPCSVGGRSWFNQVDFRTGAPIPGAVTSQYLSDSINVGFNVIQLPPPSGSTNPQYIGLFRQGKATNVEKPVTPPEPLPVGKRISWREIAQ